MTLFLSRRAQNSQLPVVGWSLASEQTPCLPEAELMRPWLCSLAPPGLHPPDVLPSLGLSRCRLLRQSPLTVSSSGKPSSRLTLQHTQILSSLHFLNTSCPSYPFMSMAL